MRVSSIFLLALFVCPIVARAATIERPITSAVRAGRSSTTARIAAGGAFNGERFLITWVSADRDGQAMLLDPTGEPVSAVTGLPFRPKYSFWNGDEWIVIGEGWVRIDAEGRLLDHQPRSLGLPSGFVSAAAWTGTSLIVVTTVVEPTFPYTLFLATYDAQMQLRSIREHDVSSTAHLAWDGQAALLLYRRSGESMQLRANILDRDGAIQRSKAILINTPIAVGTTGDGDGYRVMARKSSNTSSAYYTSYHVDHDLAVEQNFPPIGRASNYAGEGPTLAWDGTAFHFFYFTGNPKRELYGIRLSREGVVLEDALVTTYFDNHTTHWLNNEVSSVSAAGTNFMFYMPLEPIWGPILKVRRGSSIAELAASETRELERGAYAQTASEAASSATQTLVSWAERPAPGGPSWIYATRVGANGMVRDPQSLIVGVDACAGSSVASAGDSFLVAWRTAQGVMTARVDADGVVSQRTRIGRASLYLPCQGHVDVFSNGTAYLVVWMSYEPGGLTVFAKRVSATGDVLDAVPLELGAAWDSFEGASNGTDYLIAWDGKIIRVDADGNRLDPMITRDPWSSNRPFPELVWWNGASYSILEREQQTPQARYRIHREASNGVRVKVGEWLPYNASFAGSLGDGICSGLTCTLLERRVDNGTATIHRIVVTDAETPSIQSVDTITIAPARSSSQRVAAIPFSVNGGRLFAAYTRHMLEAPYSGISRVFLAPMDPPRTRLLRR